MEQIDNFRASKSYYAGRSGSCRPYNKFRFQAGSDFGKKGNMRILEKLGFGGASEAAPAPKPKVGKSGKKICCSVSSIFEVVEGSPLRHSLV
jgi:hypothetical protein